MSRRDRLERGDRAVLAWLADGATHWTWERGAPLLSVLERAQRHGVCVLVGERVSLSTAGRERVERFAERRRLGRVGLPWPWTWGERRSDGGQWIRIACGPRQAVELYSADGGESVVVVDRHGRETPLPVEVLVAYVSELGYRITGPKDNSQPKRKRSKRRRALGVPRNARVCPKRAPVAPWNHLGPTEPAPAAIAALPVWHRWLCHGADVNGDGGSKCDGEHCEAEPARQRLARCSVLPL